jgi:hypothetical protein
VALRERVLASPGMRLRAVPIPLSLLLAAAALAGCGFVSRTAPPATPSDFLGISGALAARGVSVSQVVAGDAGCNDPALARTAISFRASGLDQATAVPVHLYIFGSPASYEKLRSSVDACARSFVTGSGALESVDASPFVVVGQGPWAPNFSAAIRQGLTQAAGNGG